jgi:hypothetical protein
MRYVVPAILGLLVLAKLVVTAIGLVERYRERD